jgi:hypothetical protein
MEAGRRKRLEGRKKGEDRREKSKVGRKRMENGGPDGEMEIRSKERGGKGVNSSLKRGKP